MDTTSPTNLILDGVAHRGDVVIVHIDSELSQEDRDAQAAWVRAHLDPHGVGFLLISGDGIRSVDIARGATA